MATYTGDEGLVYSGANAVAEVTDFEYTKTQGKIKDSAKGDAAETYKKGRTDATGTVNCWWDPDNTGQKSLRVGQTVTLHLHPEGISPGETDFTADVVIDSMTVTSPKDESICEAKFSFHGILVEDVIS